MKTTKMVITTNGIQHIQQFIKTIQYTTGFVLVDTNTNRDCFPLLKQYLPNFKTIEINAGEEFKNLNTSQFVWQQLLHYGADRKSILINLGGGVVTDLGGFTASTFKRGIRFINIPTSLLAMVDASVGGKTGIDFLDIKNCIGTFQKPEAVFVDANFLKTLPKRHFVNGTAEILKHGLISSSLHFHNFLSMGLEDDFSEIIQESIAIKKNVVEKDPYEKGLRKILNFGHTVGHAIESYSLKNEEDYLLHGEAIALGMIAEAHLAVKYASLSQFEFENIKASILNYFNQRNYTKHQTKEMLSFLKQDKKNEAGRLKMSLLKKIGEAVFDLEVEIKDVEEALNFVLNESI